MKSKIYEFDPVIYPTRLWVCKKPLGEDIKELFYPLDDDGNILDDFGNSFAPNRDSFAHTLIVGNKNSHWKGCLVSILKPSECGAGICAHESMHVIAYICEQLGIALKGFLDSEAWAYLMQWSTNCIWGALVNDPDKMNGKLL